jgi:putative AdoMet-dependent methyltransferase
MVPGPTDPFPPSEFDEWAAAYDLDVTRDDFPFTGYRRALAEVARAADPRAGMSVLDLGVGTGNLAELFASLGCELWCADFSEEMLERARAKLPAARLFLHDLRAPFPPALARRFDRIVSAYVFHHFEIAEKIAIVQRLVRDHLDPRGRLVIADISFPTQAALETYRLTAGDLWEDEPFWIAGEAVPALEAIGVAAQYAQVSPCAGLYQITRQLS